MLAYFDDTERFQTPQLNYPNLNPISKALFSVFRHSTESLPSWRDSKIETKENKSVNNQGSLIIGLGSIDSLLINFQFV